MRILNLAERAKAYGMPSEIVDGNDANAVYGSARRAVDRARSGGGPTMIEAKSFRMLGHAAHDNQSYIPKGVLEQWRKRDPIARLEKQLASEKTATGREIEDVRRKVEEVITRELAWAESQPLPKGEDALGGVYAEAAETSAAGKN
jgi:pyruvate dehydrogenase E1 component alpha subunit